MTVIETTIDIDKSPLEHKKHQFVICRHCRFHLTRSEYALTINSHHEHIQCNPQGLTFVFKCFSQVPGSHIIGDPTLEHTWFSGYHWQICLCQGCGEHLGWYFSKQEDKFFALINQKIQIIDKMDES